VGREEEGSSSNRPELAAFFLALRDTLREEPLLYLCDNQSLLKAVNRWNGGEGGKATLVGVADADILAAAIEILRNRIAAGTTTILVKVKAHRGEAANEGADILADKAISDPKVGKEWCQLTNRAVFTRKKPCREAGKVICQHCHSTFDNSVRDAILREATENEVSKHEERLAGAWRQMNTLRHRYERLGWCKGDDIEDCTHKQRYEVSYQSMVKVLQQNTWIVDRKFLKSCVRARAGQDDINHPAFGKWTADFMFRQNESRAFLGKYLNDPHVPWRHRRREMMAIAGIIPVAEWLAKIKRQSDVDSRLCKRARGQRGASTDKLPEKTYGHINSAFCNGMATTVKAAHHFIWRYLYASMQAAQTPAS